jgi:hypothetical protein
MSLYLYCLSDEDMAGAIEEVEGVAGARVRLFSCGPITAVASETGDERVGVTRENVIAHERVIRRVLAETTPLPFRFGTVTTAAGLDNYIESRRADIESLLDRVRGAVEMGVKIIWDKEAIENSIKKAGGSDLAQAGPGAVGPGRAFLLARKREMSAGEYLEKQADCIARWLDNKVNSSVRETIVSVRPAQKLVIVAAHLVDRALLEAYRDRLDQIRNERGDLRFLTSGIWPPYSFANIRT